MPRRPRMYFPDMCYHIVQRGNNKAACFIRPHDYRTYLDLWQQMSRRYHVRAHAYCLMTNHIHFMASPKDETGISNTLKVVGSCYASYFNKTYQRTGTLWEGRHKASLVDTANYFYACMAYIELNPVRAAMVAHPDSYEWSSYHSNALQQSSCLTPHDEHLIYRLIRTSAHHCMIVGEEAFQRWRLESGQCGTGCGLDW